MSGGLLVVSVSALVTTGISAEWGVAYVLVGAALSGLGLGYLYGTRHLDRRREREAWPPGS
jgi:hypothetical protein